MTFARSALHPLDTEGTNLLIDRVDEWLGEDLTANLERHGDGDEVEGHHQSIGLDIRLELFTDGQSVG